MVTEQPYLLTYLLYAVILRKKYRIQHLKKKKQDVNHGISTLSV